VEAVSSRPFFPGFGIREHFDKEAAHDRARMHSFALQLVGNIRIDQRQARGRLV
jgi:hypothetical protein